MKESKTKEKTDKYVGEVIGNFLVVRLCDEKSSNGHSLYDVVCTKCGHELRKQRISDLKRKNKGDRCKHIDRRTHWLSPRLNGIFKGMMNRCYRTKNKDYKNYGGKGISICNEWLNNPQTFNTWAIESGYREDLTIDRIDEEKDYCPENCEWLSREENAKWKGNTNKIFVFGVLDSGRGWARSLGFGVNYINRYKRKYGVNATEEMISNVILESPELCRVYLY